MNHYPHHIGDFDRATRHLTRIERSVYRDLIELYYDTEQPLVLDVAWLCRKVIAHSNEEATAVEQVLNEFFTKTATGWYHTRCEEEIAAYRSNTSQKAMAGKASAEARRQKRLHALNGNSTDVEQPLNSDETKSNGDPTNQEPRTINHSIGSPKGSRLPPDWVLSEELTTWAKAERPDLDIEKTADSFRDYWHGIPGAKGRKTDWPATWRNWVRSQRKLQQGQADIARVTVPGSNEPDPALEKIKRDAARAVPPSPEIRARMQLITKAGAS